MSNAREQIKAEIIKVIAEAQAAGDGDGSAAARRAFPGLPEMVLWECWTELELDQTDAWWEAVERTIDGELVERAIASAARANDGGGV